MSLHAPPVAGHWFLHHERIEVWGCHIRPGLRFRWSSYEMAKGQYATCFFRAPDPVWKVWRLQLFRLFRCAFVFKTREPGSGFFYRFKKSFVGRHGSTLRAESSPEGGWATAAAGWCGRQCAWVTWQIVMSKAQLSTSFNVSPQWNKNPRIPRNNRSKADLNHYVVDIANHCHCWYITSRSLNQPSHPSHQVCCGHLPCQRPVHRHWQRWQRWQRQRCGRCRRGVDAHGGRSGSAVKWVEWWILNFRKKQLDITMKNKSIRVRLMLVFDCFGGSV